MRLRFMALAAATLALGVTSSHAALNVSQSKFMNGWTLGVTGGYQVNRAADRAKDKSFFNQIHMDHSSPAFGLFVDYNRLLSPNFFMGFGLDGVYASNKHKPKTEYGNAISQGDLTIHRTFTGGLTARAGWVFDRVAIDANMAFLATYMQSIMKNDPKNSMRGVRPGYAPGVAISTHMGPVMVTAGYRYEIHPQLRYKNVLRLNSHYSYLKLGLTF